MIETNISSLMTSPAITLNPDAAIKRAARLMEKHRVGSVIIVDQHERPLGIVTDRDIVTRCIAYGLSVDEPVSEIMSSRLFVIYEDDKIPLAAYFMGVKQVKRLVVLDNMHRITGVISIGDIARTEYDEHGIGETVARISYPDTDFISNPHYGVEVDDFRL